MLQSERQLINCNLNLKSFQDLCQLCKFRAHWISNLPSWWLQSSFQHHWEKSGRNIQMLSSEAALSRVSTLSTAAELQHEMTQNVCDGLDIDPGISAWNLSVDGAMFAIRSISLCFRKAVDTKSNYVRQTRVLTLCKKCQRISLFKNVIPNHLAFPWALEVHRTESFSPRRPCHQHCPPNWRHDQKWVVLHTWSSLVEDKLLWSTWYYGPKKSAKLRLKIYKSKIWSLTVLRGRVSTLWPKRLHKTKGPMLFSHGHRWHKYISKWKAWMKRLEQRGRQEVKAPFQTGSYEAWLPKSFLLEMCKFAHIYHYQVSEGTTLNCSYWEWRHQRSLLCTTSCVVQNNVIPSDISAQGRSRNPEIKLNMESWFSLKASLSGRDIFDTEQLYVMFFRPLYGLYGNCFDLKHLLKKS